MAQGDLTTLANVQAWLFSAGDPPASSGAVLGQLITEASAFVVNYLNRPVIAADYVERYDGMGETVIVRNWPIVSVTSIAIAGGPNITNASPDGLSPGWLFDANSPRISLIGYCAPRDRLNVQVSYRAGYATVPPDLEQAVIQIVAEQYKARDRIGVNSKTLGGQETVSFQTKAFNDYAKGALANYRRLAPV